MFARHETFHPRYGWFRKAHSHVAADPRVFFGDDAPVRIGVGKNMVRAIRFWGLAAKLIAADPESANRRAPDLMTTPLGDSLFGSGGWDPYMEDPGTLWLLHWLLLAPPCHLPVWWLAFNEFHAVEFTEDDLHATVDTQLDLAAEWRKPHPSSVKKDVGALLRTYAPPRATRTSADRRHPRLPAPRTQSDQPLYKSGPISVLLGNEDHPSAGGADLLDLGLRRPR